MKKEKSMKDNKDKILYALTIIKYIAAIGLTIFAYTNIRSRRYLVMAVIELLLIAVVSNLLIKVNKIAAIIVNSILVLLYNAQMLVLYFGSSYITMIMLTNLESVEDLSGKAFEYIMGIIIVLVISCLPIKEVKLSKLANYRIFQDLSHFIFCLFFLTAICTHLCIPMLIWQSRG